MTPRERGLVLVQISITFLAFLLSTLFMLLNVHPAVSAVFRVCALLSTVCLRFMGAMLTGNAVIEGQEHYFETEAGNNQGHMIR